VDKKNALSGHYSPGKELLERDDQILKTSGLLGGEQAGETTKNVEAVIKIGAN
jgi:hypothetical protein